MVRTGIVIVALILAGVVAVGSAEKTPAYGYSVEVTPDEEFENFVQCTLMVFDLETGRPVSNLPSLRIMEGDANSLVFRDSHGTEVEFSCTVDPKMTEVSYELEGTLRGAPVLNHLSTVRLR